MLDGLGSVRWDSLRHAYGSAADVPEALRALAGEDPDAQDDALEQLAASIFHQGDVYASTLAAWPFLVELACSKKLDDERTGILLLNMGTAAYFSTLVDESGEEEEAVEDEESVALVKPAEARKHVDADFPRLMKLFAEAGPKVKVALVNLCVQSPEQGRNQLEVLRSVGEGTAPIQLLSKVAQAVISKDDEKTHVALDALFEALPEAADRADDDEAPLHAIAAMASEDAVIVLLTEE